MRFSNSIKCQVRYVVKRSYKNFDQLKFLAEFRKISWWDLYCCADVNVAVKLFTSKFSQVLDKHAPLKKFQNRKRYAPWISNSTKELMQERNSAQAWATATKQAEDWSQYKRLRNRVTKNLKVDKYNWQNNKLDHSYNDSGKLWSTIKGWLNWSSLTSPTKLFHEGCIETSPRKMANIMNRFYVDKVEKIREGLPVTEINPLEHLRKL